MSWLPQFELHNTAEYERWRDAKLRNYPQNIESLIVEVKDPKNLTASEQHAMKACLQKTNMVIYSGGTKEDPDRFIPQRMGAHFGLERLDHNAGAKTTGISALEVQSDAWHKRYIPYTNRQIRWHTDGYYNELSRQIYGMSLHCVRPAKEGGCNSLMDHEVAYILLREKNPEWVNTLMHESAMMIPKNREDKKVDRPDRYGPVFMQGYDGNLHMRFTARARNVVWSDDKGVLEAKDFLLSILQSETRYIFSGVLQSGQGLVCNNVLHNRTAFDTTEDESPRLLYRLRYFDRAK